MSSSSFSRRTVLQAGAVTALCGLPTLRARAQAPRARRLVLLYMEGGPSQLDTFDPKPGTQTGGPFSALSTKVDGLTMSQHLPTLAALAPKLCVVRTLGSREGNHDRARYLMHTGHVPQGGVDHPSLGSVLARARHTVGLPGYVSILGPGKDAGILGAAFAPFPVPSAREVMGLLHPPETLTPQRWTRRTSLWRALEDTFGAAHPGVVSTGQRAVGEQALHLLEGDAAKAFDVQGEPEAVHTRYGSTAFQQGCLMARRLLESGVPCVEVTLKGWDTHKDNFPTVARLSTELDQGMGALITDLDERGLLQDTLVVWLGDFGRTPRINAAGGRDHHPKSGCAVLCGGGVKGGVVVGATNATGEEVVDRPVGVPDLFVTISQLLGLDPRETWEAPSGRPIQAVDGGKVMTEVLG